MDHINKGQVNTNAADIYEAFFVPALFQEWAGRVANAANIQAGQHVLDVACGTGILSRTVAEWVSPNGSVTGLDMNDGMLAVARRKASHIEWKQGLAEKLPFEDEAFDAVVSQFGLMFFDDRQAAIREMMRVLRQGGHLAVAVWDSIDHTLGYRAMVDLLLRLFGEDAANGLRAPYILGNIDELRSLFRNAGIQDVKVNTLDGKARFPSIESWVFTDIKGWVLADMIDDEQYALLLKEANKSLSAFVQKDGTVEFDAPAHIVSAIKV
jgi:SAM-dependent methyltransferase